MPIKKNRLLIIGQPTYLTVRKTANLAIGAAAWTKITFDSIIYQDGIVYDNVNDIATITENGIYNLSLFVRWVHLSTPYRFIGFSINGVVAPPQIYSDYHPQGSTAAKPPGNAIDVKRGLNVGDTIAGYVYSTVATTLTAVAGVCPEMTILKLAEL